MYEEKYDKYSATVKGLAIISIMSPTVYMNYPGFSSVVFLDGKNLRIGFLTGYYTIKDGVNLFQVEFENDFTFDGVAYHWGCVDASQYRTYDVGKDSSAKNIMANLIANNKTILENNLLCAGMISYMEANGETVPVAHRSVLYNLQSRLEARNGKILNSPFIDSKQTASPTGFDQYASNLQSFMNNPGIGIAPVVIYLVVTVVITLLSTALIYLMFKPDYSESKSHLKQSSDLTKALATLSPEARARAIADLEGQIDKAYITGKTDGSGGGILKTGMYLGAGFLGFTVIDKFLQNRDKK